MSIPSLNKWLESLGLQNLQKPFANLGISSTHDLTSRSDEELGVLFEGLKIRPLVIIKLTIAIQQLDATKTTQLVLTHEEGQAMKELSTFSREVRQILAKVQDTIKKTNISSTNAQKDINKAFKELSIAVSKRKEELLKSVTKEASSKTTALSQQSTNISKILSGCDQATRDSNKLLKAVDITELQGREDKIRKRVTDIVKTQLDKEPIEDPEILFMIDTKPVIEMVAELGVVVSGIVPNPPKITTVNADVGSVQVSWEPVIPNLEPGHGGRTETGNILRYGILIGDNEQKESEGETVWKREAVSEAKQQQCTFSDLGSGHQYAVQVRAMNDINETWGMFGPKKIFTTLKCDILTSVTYLWNENNKAEGLEIIDGHKLKCTHKNGWVMCSSKTVIRTGQHTFDVKILQDTQGGHVMIGIVPESVNVASLRYSHEFYHLSDSYGYYCYNGKIQQKEKITQYGDAISGVGDTVTVTVNMDKKTVQFSLNGKQFPLFNISVPGPMCPAVALHFNGTIVELN